VWQHGGVSLSPRGVVAGAGVGGSQEDALGVIFFWNNETHYLQFLLLSLVRWLWNSIWKMFVTVILVCCFSALFFSLYMYTHTYTYRCNNCILYFLVLTKPVPTWVPVKASFSTSDTIVTLYRHRSTNRCVSLGMAVSNGAPQRLRASTLLQTTWDVYLDGSVAAWQFKKNWVGNGPGQFLGPKWLIGCSQPA